VGIRAKLEPDKIQTMPIGLERRHNTGQLHFITLYTYVLMPSISTSEQRAKKPRTLASEISKTKSSRLSMRMYAFHKSISQIRPGQLPYEYA
jgi:hypothetical protein